VVLLVEAVRARRVDPELVDALPGLRVLSGWKSQRTPRFFGDQLSPPSSER
jgi:hypothetical protein